ncbi:hypothetical protein OG604_35910 [Streptomyces sp. NBC_01231]|nr:hypothetical protein OG604_35910 [Streptomyces sp. NBC_01231]
MNLALKYRQQKLREAADAASMSYDATIADIVQATEIPANPSNRFNTLAPLLKRLGAPMHAAWIGETQLAHPTLTAAEAFFDNSDEDTVKLLDEPLYRQDGPSPAERAPYIAMVLVWCAMESFARLIPGDPWRAELQRIASEAGIDNSSTDQVA